ncbi:MAG: glycosyltransferase family 2 protein [Actinomycetota bacterium]|nr:glycosyltransferase family 2 protein [Actinomycetota bacterium]
MIAFGAAVTDTGKYERFAQPGIERAKEPDSLVLREGSEASIFRNYNLLLDEAGAREDLEALVLLHQDVELVDADFCERIRNVLADPEVAVVGCAGATGARSIAWWQGTVRWASLTHRYEEHTGGEFPGPTWVADSVPADSSPGEVDSVDGIVVVLSAWAVRNLRFDESLGQLHGYDFDICMQAKAQGKKVFAADFRAIHHHSVVLISDPEAWIAAYIRLAEKWDHLFPEPDGDPEHRALRAEAEAACAEAMMVSHQYRASAVNRHLTKANTALGSTREDLAAAQREVLELRAKYAAAKAELDALRARVAD